MNVDYVLKLKRTSERNRVLLARLFNFYKKNIVFKKEYEFTIEQNNQNYFVIKSSSVIKPMFLKNTAPKNLSKFVRSKLYVHAYANK